eukprot:12388.XXX_222434_221807_1 [CDS] Oithona nana genome sequencing.
MDTELGVEFATYSVTCTSDDDIYVWAGVKKCIKLEAGTPETFKLVGSGWGKKHLAVCRSKINGDDRTYDARIYMVKDDWTIKIEREESSPNNHRVYRILDNEESKELTHVDVKLYKTTDPTEPTDPNDPNDPNMTERSFFEIIRNLVNSVPDAFWVSAFTLISSSLSSVCNIL